MSYLINPQLMLRTLMVSVLTFGWLSAVYAAPEQPDVFVKRVGDALVAKLKTQRAASKKDPVLLQTIVKQNIEPYIDFDGFARGVMGKYVREATAEQRQLFSDTFKTSLMRTYSNSLAAYDNETYTIRPYVKGPSDDKASVTMDFKTDKGTNIPVTYQMVVLNNQWKIRNLQLNGIDVGLTFRNQFNATVQKYNGDLNQAIKYFIPSASTTGQ